MVESLYRQVIPEGNLAAGKELDALVEAHFRSLADADDSEANEQ